MVAATERDPFVHVQHCPRTAIVTVVAAGVAEASRDPWLQGQARCWSSF